MCTVHVIWRVVIDGHEVTLIRDGGMVSFDQPILFM